ncbi:MAG: type 2 lantipeptide synthetase LanM [Acidobacteriota bacterium]|jgi:type 2 lantibiotic biosynthesis protein LanM
MTGISSPPQLADSWPGPELDGRALVELIAARAMTLEEVLGSGRHGEAVGGVDAAGLLERWSHIFAGGDRAALQRRLAWDGLDERLIAAALGSLPTPAIPLYLQALPDILAEPAPPAPSSDEAEVPFGHLLTPWVQHARRRLAALAPDLTTLLAPGAQRAAEQHLLEQLSAVAAAALHERFHAFRDSRRSGPADGGASPGDRTYRAFVDSLRGPQLAGFLVAHPVLTRHLFLLAWQWTEAMAELVIRLADDLEALGQAFADGDVLGPVEAVDTGLSDRHAGGRQVAALRFASGAQVVYKPRDVTLEAAWAELMQWLAREGLDCAPPAPRVLARPGYGWVERVQAEEVSDGTDFARRAGALVFLAWLLGGVDLHEDNVIATAHGPALIDAEALLQPLRTDLTRAAASSILATGLLTFPILTAQGSLVDAGGLVGGARSPSPHRQWENVNTDAMRPVSRAAPARSPANLSRTHGQPWRPTRRRAELEEGFGEAYRFCLAHRHRLLDPAGPLQPFALAEPRVVFRPTESYVRLQRALLAPAYQRLGVERSIALDALNRVFAASPRRPPLWPLVAEERAALERLDIPRFTLPATAEALVAASGEVIPGVVGRSGWASLADRLQGLSEQQLAHHLHLLRVCATTQPLADEEARPDDTEREAALVAWREALQTAAVRCGEEIERAIFPDRTAPALARWGDLDAADLSHGLPGVALLFAALHRVTDEPRWRSRARACWQAALSRPQPPESLGACKGTGGRLYALALLAALSDDADAADAARRLLAAFPCRAIAADRRLDVFSGGAGAILGLLATHAALGESLAIALAQECARHLLAVQRPEGGWSPADAAAPGFAHGAAGIACALARLAAVTGEVRLVEAARRGLEFEFSLFDTRRGTFRTPARYPGGAVRHVSMSAWCNGAPGVALALATAALPPSARVGLDEALAVTRACGLAGLDHLCCGSLGIIDVLLTSGQRLGQESLIGAATARGIVVLRRAMGSDTFALEEAVAAPAVRLGLFHGLAGVGYQALRLAAPATFPSLLAFLLPGNGQP